MSRIYVPTTNAEQWAQFLADPDKHWRQGHSARTLAHSWQEAAGFPSEVARALLPTFPGIELLLAMPEHKVPLPGGRAPSQNDIWVLARDQRDLISIAVEGKVSEPFGPTIQEWQAASGSGKEQRLAFLLKLIELPSVPGMTRYQLLHRTASAIIEAHRFNAAHAVMLVHSFSPTREWFSDYSAFVALLGGNATPGSLVSLGPRSGVSLHMAWVCGDATYLSR